MKDKLMNFLDRIRQDLAYGIRGLARNPGFAAVVVLTLALGIGANTAIFSVVHGVLMRPLPYRAPEQLVILNQAAPKIGDDSFGFSVPDFTDFRERTPRILRALGISLNVVHPSRPAGPGTCTDRCGFGQLL